MQAVQQLTKYQHKTLETLEVCYLDDSDLSHPARWKVRQYRINKDGELELFIGSKWCFAVDQEGVKIFQKYGGTATSYGTVFSHPKMKDRDIFNNPPRLIEIFSKGDIFVRRETDLIHNACAVLGVHFPLDKAEIKQAYRVLVKTAHPDNGGDSESFRLIQQSYEILKTEIEK